MWIVLGLSPKLENDILVLGGVFANKTYFW